MAFQAVNVRGCRDDAESKFSVDEIDSARPLMNAFHFRILEVMHQSHGSTRKYHERAQFDIDKLIAALGFDGEAPGGEGE